MDLRIELDKKAKRVQAFTQEEILLTHYETLNKNSKKDVFKYFKTTVLENKIEDNELVQKELEGYLKKIVQDAPFPGITEGEPKFTFIDLFAGIGGFRMALQELGGKCLFSSEWDKYAQKTYMVNYGQIPFGDITSKEIKKLIPKKFDILCGGFPCQPFSIAGVSKKNSLGRKHGFDDVKQGNLFFHITEIIERHQPKAFFLENVKNLMSHDGGETFRTIKEHLINLGYSFDNKVVDAKYFVPQHRERTLMVGFKKKYFGNDIKFDFDKILFPKELPKFKEILEPSPNGKYTLSEHLWNYLQQYAKKHKEKGNGFGYGLVDLNGTSRTMSARYYKDGAEILIPQKNKVPRRMTPRECSRLQGYPSNFIIPVSDNQAYKQFGNTVVVPVIRTVGKHLVKQMLNHKK